MKFIPSVVGIISITTAIALLFHAPVYADPLAHYQPSLLTKAQRALEWDRPDRTLALLEGRVQVLRRASHRAEANSLICLAWYEKGSYDKAERACDAAVELDTGATAWRHLNNRGVMRARLGRIDEALDDFRAAAARNPRARMVRQNVAACEEMDSRDLLALSALR